MVNQSPLETAISRAMIRWSLTKSTPLAETEESWIVRVEQNGRNFAVLKIFKPGAAEEGRRRAALLRWYAGEGAATVFDMHSNTVFMEWLDGIPLGEAARKGHDEEAVIALATVAGQLHRHRPDPPADLIALRDWLAPLFSADIGAWPRTARDLYARAGGIARALFDRPTAQLPLHGDLHHETVISSSRGWLAIAPIGLLGDPAYDLAPAFLHPEGALDLLADPRRIAARADIFSARLGFPRKRILGWAAAHAALSACRDLAAGRAITVQLAVLAPLLAAYDVA